MALGVAPSSVVRMVLRRVAVLVGTGVIVGSAASLWASTFVATLLYGLQPRDISTLLGAPAVLGAIALLAGWIPARRASRIDPASVLREG
jgi:putative ABC transport system permease protein